jgi:hypothetical protein
VKCDKQKSENSRKQAERTALIDNQTASVAKPKCHNGGEIEQLQD